MDSNRSVINCVFPMIGGIDLRYNKLHYLGNVNIKPIYI